MTAAGDIQFTEEPRGLFESDAVSLFMNAPLPVGNLEMVLSKSEQQADSRRSNLRSDPRLAPILKKLNCQVMSFANNHCFDFGEVGFLDTLDEMNRLGIRIVGAGKTVAEAQAPVLVEQGVKVSFLAFSSSFWPGSTASPSKPGILSIGVTSQWDVNARLQLVQPGTPPRVFTEPIEEDLKTVREIVSKASADSDLVIVFAHWGVAYRNEPTDYQVQIAHELIDSGAHLILGGHPHVIQAVEHYKSGVVFYSLGNFIFQAEDLPPWGTRHRPAFWKRWSRQSILVKTHMTTGRIGHVDIWPLSLSECGTPFLAKGKEGENILDALCYLSELEGTILETNYEDLRASLDL